jgi:hypothetical protein
MIKIIKYKNKSNKRTNKYRKRKNIKKTRKYLNIYKCKKGGSSTLTEDSSPDNYKDNYENNIANVKL